VGPNVERYDASVVTPSALMNQIRERQAVR
jgi:hypothetical protein